MSAKHKLNSAHFLGALLAAGLVGGLTRSFLVFLIALVALVGAACHAGAERAPLLPTRPGQAGAAGGDLPRCVGRVTPTGVLCFSYPTATGSPVTTTSPA